MDLSTLHSYTQRVSVSVGSKRSIYVRGYYRLAKIYETSWRLHSYQKAAELLSKAVQSVGETVALYEAKHLNRLLEEYERIDGILNQIAQEIAALLGEIPIASQLRSIKGLGTIYIAAILAGAGDLTQYVHGRQLLRKAGLNLAESMSGKRKGQIILSKRGDSTLRKYLYLATLH